MSKKVLSRIFRWCCLILYLLAISLFLYYINTEEGDKQLTGIFSYSMSFLGVWTVVSLWSFGGFCSAEALTSRRLASAASIFSIMGGLLIVGMVLPFYEYSHKMPGIGLPIIFIIGIIVWFICLIGECEGLNASQALRKMTKYIAVAVVFELFITILMHLDVSRRPGCMVGVFTGMGVFIGIAVLFWLLGPAIAILFFPVPRIIRIDDGMQPEDV